MEIDVKTIFIVLFAIIFFISIIIATIFYLKSQDKPQPTLPPPPPSTEGQPLLQIISPDYLKGYYLVISDSNDPAISFTKDQTSATTVNLAVDNISTIIGKTFGFEYIIVQTFFYANVYPDLLNPPLKSYAINFEENPAVATENFATLYLDENNKLSVYFKNNNLLTVQVDDKQNVYFDTDSENTIVVNLVPTDQTPLSQPTSTFTPPPDPELYTFLKCQDKDLNLTYYLSFNENQSISKTSRVRDATPMNYVIAPVYLENFEFSIAPLLTNAGLYVTIQNAGDIRVPNNHSITFTNIFYYNSQTSASLFLCPDNTIKAFFDADHCYQLHATNTSFFFDVIMLIKENTYEISNLNFLNITLVDDSNVPEIIDYTNSYISTIWNNGVKFYLATDPNTNTFTLVQNIENAQKFLFSYGQINQLSTNINILNIMDEFKNYIIVNVLDMTLSKDILPSFWTEVDTNFRTVFDNYNSKNSIYIKTATSQMSNCNLVVESTTENSKKSFNINEFILQNNLKFRNVAEPNLYPLTFSVELIE